MIAEAQPPTPATLTGKPDLWKLYRKMLKSRIFEEKVIELWKKGMISGEMHTGLGEEAVVAGTLDHIREGDALALDHRGTSPLVMRNLDISSLLQEFLGNEEGLCRGYGGHMHLFSRQHMAASTGIIGASGPLGSGFALALQYLHPENIVFAYFGEGALNQGTLLESFNLASTWKLPVLFICKDNSLSLTTDSASVTGGKIAERIKGFGIPFVSVDGLDVEAVWDAGLRGVKHIRAGNGPYFIHARCVHLEGHFLGDPLLDITRHALKQVKQRSGSLLKSVTARAGTRLKERLKGLKIISSLAAKAAKQSRKKNDPLKITRKKLSKEKDKLLKLENEVKTEIEGIVSEVLSAEKQ